MESFSSFEGRHIPDEEMIGILAGVGLEHPLAKEAYAVWYKGHEEEADAIGGDLPRISVAIRRAKIYYRAGFKDIAIKDLEDTLMIAEFMRAAPDEVTQTRTDIEVLLAVMRIGEEVK